MADLPSLAVEWDPSTRPAHVPTFGHKNDADRWSMWVKLHFGAMADRLIRQCTCDSDYPKAIGALPHESTCPLFAT